MGFKEKTSSVYVLNIYFPIASRAETGIYQLKPLIINDTELYLTFKETILYKNLGNLLHIGNKNILWLNNIAE